MVALLSDTLFFVAALCFSVSAIMYLRGKPKDRHVEVSALAKGNAMSHARTPVLFRRPNLLAYALDRRGCASCEHQGLIAVPFGAGCPNCGAIQVISGDAVRYGDLKIGEEFYVVGHVSYPYAVWSKRLSIVVDGQDGQQMAMNAYSEIDGKTVAALFEPYTYVVPVSRALIGDRFSFN